uniref:Uncharacterized protein n=1 Tax=Pavo cristatus TaxID=9049 RepID=A0A8C9G7J5_PAVCR
SPGAALWGSALGDTQELHEALAEPELCYVLDAILFLYGIVLTILYCRLKVSFGTPSPLGVRAQRPPHPPPPLLGVFPLFPPPPP